MRFAVGRNCAAGDAAPEREAPAEHREAAGLDERESRIVEAERRAEALLREKKQILSRQSALELLSARGLAGEFADFLTGEDAQETKKRVDAFERAYRKAVDAEVSRRICGFSPAGAGQTRLSREDFQRMSYKERIRLRREEPEVYRSLAEGR